MGEGPAGLRDGRFRALAQSGAERWAAAGDVPTLRELGVDAQGGAQRGIVGPPGLPEPIQRCLIQAFGAALADPAFRAEAERVDLPLRAMLGDDYRDAVLGTEGRLREFWKRRPWRDQRQPARTGPLVEGPMGADRGRGAGSTAPWAPRPRGLHGPVPGIALCLGIALTARLLQALEERTLGHPYLDGRVLAILLGMARWGSAWMCGRSGASGRGSAPRWPSPC